MVYLGTMRIQHDSTKTGMERYIHIYIYIHMLMGYKEPVGIIPSDIGDTLG